MNSETLKTPKEIILEIRYFTSTEIKQVLKPLLWWKKLPKILNVFQGERVSWEQKKKKMKFRL